MKYLLLNQELKQDLLRECVYPPQIAITKNLFYCLVSFFKQLGGQSAWRTFDSLMFPVIICLHKKIDDSTFQIKLSVISKNSTQN